MNLQVVEELEDRGAHVQGRIWAKGKLGNKIATLTESGPSIDLLDIVLLFPIVPQDSMDNSEIYHRPPTRVPRGPRSGRPNTDLLELSRQTLPTPFPCH